jgi:hypothetical protein
VANFWLEWVNMLNEEELKNKISEIKDKIDSYIKV